MTWQYSEIQRNSSEATTEARILKRSNLELNLILHDIKFGAEAKEELTAALFNATLTRMQYNAINPTANIYVPTLQNIMLEIDSRISSKGLQKYQPKIAEHLVSMSRVVNRTFNQYTLPSKKIWRTLSKKEQCKFADLAELTIEISKYYEQVNPSDAKNAPLI